MSYPVPRVPKDPSNERSFRTLAAFDPGEGTQLLGRDRGPAVAAQLGQQTLVDGEPDHGGLGYPPETGLATGIRHGPRA